MSWRTVLAGALALYAAIFAVSMLTGLVIHELILGDLFRAHREFWRPALAQEPPDPAALLPYWLATGLGSSLLISLLYGWIGRAFAGPGHVRGAKFGLLVGLVGCAFAAGWSGVLALPATIWFWWSVDGLVLYVAGGVAMGWVVDRVERWEMDREPD